MEKKEDKLFVSDEVCVAKITNATGTIADVDMFFNGGTKVQQIVLTLDFAAHMKTELVKEQGSEVLVTRSVQVGDGGIKPFIDKLHRMYPNVMLVEEQYFDAMTEAQAEAAANLVENESKVVH